VVQQGYETITSKRIVVVKWVDPYNLLIVRSFRFL
jgi:hypothetical protein